MRNLVFYSVILMGLLVSCGRLDKEVMYHHSNGEPQKIEYCRYEGNKRIVEKVEFYYPDGILESKYSLKNGLMDGKMTSYYGNGEKKLEEEYKDGELNGKSVSYYVTGKRNYEANFKNGIPDGTWYYYDENGDLYNTQIFENGKLVE